MRSDHCMSFLLSELANHERTVNRNVYKSNAYRCVVVSPT